MLATFNYDSFNPCLHHGVKAKCVHGPEASHSGRGVKAVY